MTSTAILELNKPNAPEMIDYSRYGSGGFWTKTAMLVWVLTVFVALALMPGVVPTSMTVVMFFTSISFLDRQFEWIDDDFDCENALHKIERGYFSLL